MFSTAFETAHHVLAAGCVLFAVLVLVPHRVERGVGALVLCVLCAGGLLTLHGHVELGASVGVLLMASALFLLFVQLTVDSGVGPTQRRLSVRSAFACAVVAFFGAGLSGVWLPSAMNAKSPPVNAASTSWADELFSAAHIEVALLFGMGLIALLSVFLLIRRRP